MSCAAARGPIALELPTMSDRLDQQRRFFAEEIQAVCNLRSAGLVEALADAHDESLACWLHGGRFCLSA
jgi:hypothetical protein